MKRMLLTAAVMVGMAGCEGRSASYFYSGEVYAKNAQGQEKIYHDYGIVTCGGTVSDAFGLAIKNIRERVKSEKVDVFVSTESVVIRAFNILEPEQK